MRIPQATRQVDINAPQTQKISTGLFPSGAPIREVAEVLDTANKKFKQLEDLTQVTGAHTEIIRKLDTIQAEARKDSDIYNPNKYQDTIDQAISEHVNTITDPELKIKAASQFQSAGYSAWNNINSDFRRRQIENSQNKLFDWMGTAQNQYSQTSDPVMKQDLLTQADAIIDGHVESGVLSAEQARAMKKDKTTNWAKAEVMFDAQTNPDFALKKINEGQYPAIDNVVEKDNLIQTITNMKERRIKESQESLKLSRIENESNVVKGLAEGKLLNASLEQINQMDVNGEISFKFAQSWRALVTSPKAVDQNMLDDDEKLFYKHVADILGSPDKEKVNAKITEVMDDSANGRLSRENLTLLLKASLEQGRGSSEKSTKTKGVLESFSSWVGSSLRGDKKKPAIEGGRAIIEAHIQGQDTRAAADNAMKAAIVGEHPEAAMQTDIPNMVVGPDSNVRFVFPRETNVTPRRIYNSATGKLEVNQQVNQGAYKK